MATFDAIFSVLLGVMHPLQFSRIIEGGLSYAERSTVRFFTKKGICSSYVLNRGWNQSHGCSKAAVVIVGEQTANCSISDAWDTITSFVRYYVY